MDRRWLMLLGTLMLSGCGESKAPPAPAPAFQPPATTATPPAEPTDQKTADEPSPPPADQNLAEQNVAEEMPAEEKEKLSIDAPGKDPAEAPAAEEPSKDEAPNETAAASDEAAPADSEKPKKSGGKLFRGLGSSLTRALSKLPSTTPPAEEEPDPPALKDDPFPNGEPNGKE